MHESHQVQKLVKDVEAAAKERGMSKVSSVTVLVGELLGFDRESVRLHWEEMTCGTCLEGSQIKVEFVPGKLECGKCGRLFVKKGSQLNCPDCGVMGKPTQHGKEFALKQIL